MGFLYHAIKFPAITAFFFLSVWSQLKWVIIGVLTSLGIYKPAPEEDDSMDNSNNYIFLLDGMSPSLVPIPIQVVTAAIKSRVPVVQYRDLHLNRAADQQRQEEEVDKLCTICLESLEATQEVRDLSRCSHVFHRDCLDAWVDSGQVTCPLCRSMLLPPKTNLSRCGGDPPKTEERNPQLLTS